MRLESVSRSARRRPWLGRQPGERRRTSNWRRTGERRRTSSWRRTSNWRRTGLLGTCKLPRPNRRRRWPRWTSCGGAVVRKPRLAANWLRRRRLRTALSLLAISLALSCGLSPVEDLPSASDGEDGLDLVSGVGGSIAVGSGGLPGCLPGPRVPNVAPQRSGNCRRRAPARRSNCWSKCVTRRARRTNRASPRASPGTAAPVVRLAARTWTTGSPELAPNACGGRPWQHPVTWRPRAWPLQMRRRMYVSVTLAMRSAKMPSATRRRRLSSRAMF